MRMILELYIYIQYISNFSVPYIRCVRHLQTVIVENEIKLCIFG